MEEISLLNNNMINLSIINNSSNKSQKEAFLFYLQRMDIEMIDLILENKYSYFEVTKSTFIKKLKLFKSEFEALDDTDELKIIQKDRISNTYYLYEENYELKQEFTFKEVENKIVNISSQFNSELKKWCPLELLFGLDERINFKPTIEYLIELQQCTNALEELVNTNIEILDHDKMGYWINKHKSLYHQLKDKLLMFKFNDFRNLFDLLVDLKKLIECSIVAHIAVEEFDDSTQDKIQKWINDNLSLFISHIECFEGYFKDFEKVTYFGINDIIQLDIFPNIYLLRNDFLDVKKFKDLFLKHSNFSSLEVNDDIIPF
jgi:hypothetical protein